MRGRANYSFSSRSHLFRAIDAHSATLNLVMIEIRAPSAGAERQIAASAPPALAAATGGRLIGRRDAMLSSMRSR